MNGVRPTVDTVHELLLSVVPDAADQDLDPDADLHDALDIDSMDQLNLLVAVSEAFGVDIPESDYSELSTFNDIVRYVERRRG